MAFSRNKRKKFFIFGFYFSSAASMWLQLQFFGVFLSSRGKKIKFFNLLFINISFFLKELWFIRFSYCKIFLLPKTFNGEARGKRKHFSKLFSADYRWFSMIKTSEGRKNFCWEIFFLSPVAYETNFKHHGKIFKCILDCRKWKRFLRKQKRFCLQK